MIELTANPAYLHALAANTREAGGLDRAKELDSAAHDIKNLRDYAEQLERRINQCRGELTEADTQRDDAAWALMTLIRPELEMMIDEAVEQCRPLEDLSERVEKLENDLGDDIRREVRDMIQEGEIIVNIDIS